jgi:hypothetical protein
LCFDKRFSFAGTATQAERFQMLSQKYVIDRRSPN